MSETTQQPRNASRIRILPDRVANQIAAGEVVERPVAVVKELVENSLDAGATHIDITFETGGKRLVRVEDDGCGMCPDDALLSLERHATSKLRDASDLNTVHSFGFRGEALPSIASVSRFTMRTRAAGWDEGTEVVVNNGSISGTKSVGMACGTRIEVAHLFESVPARRKFLKSDRTEAAHIVLTCRLLAAAHPEVAFSLTEDGRNVFRSPACAGLAARVSEIFGREWASDLVPIEASIDGLRLTGLVSRPGPGRATRTEMFWYANQRPVENRTLSGALVEACKGWIAHNRFPAGLLFIEIDPSAIDVNVHPAKREIRLRDESGVRDFIMDAVQAQMEKLSRETSYNLPHSDKTPPAPAAALRPAITPATSPITKPAATEISPKPKPAGGFIGKTHGVSPSRGRLVANLPAEATVPATQSPSAKPVSKADALPARWRYLGAAHGNFILFETPDGLLVLNRAAAQTRVLYDDYLSALSTGHLVTQALLFPRLFELSGLLADALERNLDFFHANGFGIESFGASSFRIVSVPAWFEDEGCEDFLREAAEKIAENGIRPDRDANLARETLARLAASHAAQSSEPIDEQSGLALARRLLACKNPLADPKGNPTYVEFSRNELTKRK